MGSWGGARDTKVVLPGLGGTGGVGVTHSLQWGREHHRPEMLPPLLPPLHSPSAPRDTQVIQSLTLLGYAMSPSAL